jgi:uncharacterized surface protein with fasciclin (FAS1) repeats
LLDKYLRNHTFKNVKQFIEHRSDPCCLRKYFCVYRWRGHMDTSRSSVLSRYRLLVAATYGLTSTLASPALLGGNGCSGPGTGLDDCSAYPTSSALPFSDARLLVFAGEQGAFKRAGTPAKPGVLDVARGEHRLSVFATASKTTGLDMILSERGPFTVFMPVNRAFAETLRATGSLLLAVDDRWAETLKSHVVRGRYSAAELETLKSAATLQGGEIQFDAAKGLRVSGARILEQDLIAGNGIIHTVDRVLFPNRDRSTSDQ